MGGENTAASAPAEAEPSGGRAELWRDVGGGDSLLTPHAGPASPAPCSPGEHRSPPVPGGKHSDAGPHAASKLGNVGPWAAVGATEKGPLRRSRVKSHSVTLAPRPCPIQTSPVLSLTHTRLHTVQTSPVLSLTHTHVFCSEHHCRSVPTPAKIQSSFHTTGTPPSPGPHAPPQQPLLCPPFLRAVISRTPHERTQADGTLLLGILPRNPACGASVGTNSPLLGIE